MTFVMISTREALHNDYLCISIVASGRALRHGFHVISCDTLSETQCDNSGGLRAESLVGSLTLVVVEWHVFNAVRNLFSGETLPPGL